MLRVENLDEVIRGLDEAAGKGLLEAVTRSAGLEADKSAALARSIAPVDTGDYKSRIGSGRLPVKTGTKIPAGAWFGVVSDKTKRGDIKTNVIEYGRKDGDGGLQGFHQARKRAARAAPEKMRAAVRNYLKTI